MHVILESDYKLSKAKYEPEAWDEIINYTATILDENPQAGYSLQRSDNGYVDYNNTSQLYTPLPVFNNGFTNYKYKQTVNSDGTVTVSIMIDTLKEWSGKENGTNPGD